MIFALKRTARQCRMLRRLASFAIAIVDLREIVFRCQPFCRASALIFILAPWMAQTSLRSAESVNKAMTQPIVS